MNCNSMLQYSGSKDNTQIHDEDEILIFVSIAMQSQVQFLHLYFTTKKTLHSEFFNIIIIFTCHPGLPLTKYLFQILKIVLLLNATLPE